MRFSKKKHQRSNLGQQQQNRIPQKLFNSVQLMAQRSYIRPCDLTFVSSFIFFINYVHSYLHRVFVLFVAVALCARVEQF